ncbi:phage tail tube protein [Pseudorhodobacter sp.]|uniref:phage tail tube protein n=1 Tax=Pseudorhodobacter sp. TaxID=1934400 RepID=UPI002647F079|nr:phage tail tube protein [Pseudorhodobacter sp.]MDN5786396.1 phage tail tube protein [Pseudorhodobacter sp.]
MPRLFRKLAILNKVETTYGTNATPAALNAIIAKNVSFMPLEADEVNRDLMLPYLGNQGIILTGKHAKIEFDVEMAGAGAAGTAPKYASLLQACGFAETLTAATSAVYSIVESGVKSSTIFFEVDGTRHIMLGSRGTLTFNVAPKAIPTIRFSMTGLLGTITDQALTAVTMTGWQTPLEASSANTTMSLHGWSSIAEQLTVTLGNTVTPRFLIGSESVIISDRKVTGQAVVEATSLATIDWFARALARTRGALSLVHGKTAGNIVELAAPAIEVGKITQGQTDGILNYSLPLSFCPVTGMDEMTITIR